MSQQEKRYCAACEKNVMEPCNSIDCETPDFLQQSGEVQKISSDCLKVVPVEPTEEQQRIGDEALFDGHGASDIYRFMVAAAPQAQSYATAIHYPECWDTAAYPTIEDALNEMFLCFKCSNEDCQAQPDAAAIRALKSEVREQAPVDGAASIGKARAALYAIANTLDDAELRQYAKKAYDDMFLVCADDENVLTIERSVKEEMRGNNEQY